MESLKIVALCVSAAILYGIAHDNVTARVCVEYFTIGHPPIFATESPTLLALGWGVLATWWVGLGLGLPLAVAARAGARPKREAASFVRVIAALLGVMAVGSIAAGIAGYLAATTNLVHLIGPIAERIPPGRHVAFLADLWAHLAAYAVGGIGGLAIVARTWITRRNPTGEPMEIES